MSARHWSLCSRTATCAREQTTAARRVTLGRPRTWERFALLFTGRSSGAPNMGLVICMRLLPQYCTVFNSAYHIGIGGLARVI
ncbi:hypothetical protein HaLaN_17699 [Haematococcus lacustris]|uniref:Uncharacterized protein n=1 Tax=Haematococcus lacustris TaxID=44745 RepID=A0A699ZQ87_HAELA|nr:hypothetical protein HaLaN_17699 [Haematococcus lacustris]